MPPLPIDSMPSSVTGPSSSSSSLKQSGKRAHSIARDETAGPMGADGSMSGSSPMRRNRSLMQHGMGHGVTGVTASNKPGFVDRSARVFGVDHSARARRLQTSADSKPFKAFVQYPTVSSRMSAKAKTTSTTTTTDSSSSSTSSSSSSDESSSSKKTSSKKTSSKKDKESSSKSEKKSSKKSSSKDKSK